MKTNVKKLLLIHLGVLVIIGLYYFFKIPCPVKYFLHIKCPTCGMSHSLLSLLRGNIKESFSYNAMTVPFIFLLLFAVHKDKLKINKKLANFIVVIGVLIIFIYYIFANFIDF